MPSANSKTSVMYMYRETSLFLQKIVASHGTSIGFVAIIVAISNRGYRIVNVNLMLINL